MNTVALVELETKRSMRERAAKGTPARESKKSGTLEAQVTSKVEPQERTRKTMSKVSGVSEHKVRQAQAVKKASPERAKKVAAGEMPWTRRTSKRAALLA